MVAGWKTDGAPVAVSGHTFGKQAERSVVEFQPSAVQCLVTAAPPTGESNNNNQSDKNTVNNGQPCVLGKQEMIAGSVRNHQ